MTALRGHATCTGYIRNKSRGHHSLGPKPRPSRSESAGPLAHHREANRSGNPLERPRRTGGPPGPLRGACTRCIDSMPSRAACSWGNSRSHTDIGRPKPLVPSKERGLSRPGVKGPTGSIAVKGVSQSINYASQKKKCHRKRGLPRTGRWGVRQRDTPGPPRGTPEARGSSAPAAGARLRPSGISPPAGLPVRPPPFGTCLPGSMFAQCGLQRVVQ